MTDHDVAGHDELDALMADLDGPMVIVTTAAGDARSGCLVGFHAQCGMEPPRYRWRYGQ